MLFWPEQKYTALHSALYSQILVIKAPPIYNLYAAFSFLIPSSPLVALKHNKMQMFNNI